MGWTEDDERQMRRLTGLLAEEVGARVTVDLIERWIRDTEERVAELSADGAEPSSRVHHLAHSLKGSSALFGLTRLQALSSELAEEAGRGEWEGRRERIAALEAAFHQAVPALRAHAARLTGPTA